MLDYNLFLHNIRGYCRSRPGFMFSALDWFKPVLTGFLRFFPVPVRFFWILEIPRTGPVLGPSKNSEKTGTGPDF